MQINVYWTNKLIRILTLLVISFSFSFSDIKTIVDNNKFSQEFLNSDLFKDINKSELPNKENIKELISPLIDKKEDKNSKEINLEKEYKSFLNTLSLFDEGKYFEDIVNTEYLKRLNEIREKENNNNFTLFLFTSESVPIQSIKNFSKGIDKLRESYPNVIGRVLLQGYPIFYSNQYSGNLSKKYKIPFKLHSKYGTIKILKDGKFEINNGYEYDIKMQFEEEKTVSINIEKDVLLNLVVAKSIKNGKYYFKQKQSPNGMARFMQKIINNKATSKNIKLMVHPWAFKEMNLEDVPVLMYSFCRDDFRFKECENKYVVKGDISLTSFFELVSQYHKELLPIYESIIKESKY